MPVRFKPSSEYQRKFTWLSSPKSASFSPSKEQVAPPAGQPTTLSGGQYGIPTEPPLQRKKKPIPLTTTSTTKFINGEYQPPRDTVQDEYTLIGDQTKFGQSIKYRNLKNDRRKALAKTFNVGGKKQPVKLKNGSSSDDARPDPAPAPAPTVQVNTGKPRGTTAPAPQSAPPAPPPPTKSRAPPQERPVPSQRPPAPRVQINTGKKPATALREKREGLMNEFVQTDMEKGVADSGQEVPADYAMKYRAGVPPPRPFNPKRVSEYQKEFSWKKPVESVPMLKAEQVVYNSSMDLPRYKQDNIPRTTEYNNQFKPWTDFYKPVEPKRKESDGEGARKRSKMKRSKSEAELRTSPDRRPPAGTHQITSPDDKRLVKESLNPQRIFFPHGKYKNYRSEYHSNFRPPWKYAYEEGAWRGANPPHIIPVKDTESDTEYKQPPPPSPGNNWYAEVLELRKKADEYRKRAQGTHFSREHLAQLLAQQAELWDQVSESSTLSALSLEQPVKKQRRKENKENDQPQQSSKRPPPPRPPPPQISEPVRRKLAWEKKEEDRISGIGSIASPEGTLTSGSLSDTEGTLGADDDEGRIPTPTLRQEQVQRQSNVQRHHLDLTTPAVGGAILTSPPPKKRSPQKTPPQGQRSQPQIQHSKKRPPSSRSSSSSASAPPAPQRKEGPPAVNGMSPTFGMPTRDTHMLIDDSVSYDKGMETKFVHSPQPRKARRDRPNSGSMHGRPMSAMPQKRQPQGAPGNNKPSPIPEQMGKTYAKPTIQALKAQERLDEWEKPDDDTLSTSTRSLASSCSLASEVLERARNRRDEFWGKKPGETGR